MLFLTHDDMVLFDVGWIATWVFHFQNFWVAFLCNLCCMTNMFLFVMFC